MDVIEEIRELAEEYEACARIKGWVSNKDAVFDPPATMEQVREFEQEMHVTLPEVFVRFLTELGNGGLGVYSLEKMREQNPYAAACADLPTMIGGGLSGETWKAFAKEAEEVEFGDDENKIIALEQRLIAGGIFIHTPGCTMETLLMCKGNAAGDIYTVDFDYLSWYDKPIEGGFSFADWMIDRLHNLIAKCKYGIEVSMVTQYNERGLGMSGEELTSSLIDLRIAQLTEEGDANAADHASEIRDFYERAFGNGTFRMWIAIQRRKVIGAVGLTLTEASLYSPDQIRKTGILSNIYIKPEFRQSGMEKCILGYVLRAAENNGIDVIKSSDTT